MKIADVRTVLQMSLRLPMLSFTLLTAALAPGPVTTAGASGVPNPGGEEASAMSAYESVEFNVQVRDRTIAVKMLSPPKDKLARDPALLLGFAGERDAVIRTNCYR